MKFECLHCAGHLEADPEMAGMQIACPHCQGSLAVPLTAGVENSPTTAIPPGRRVHKRSGYLAPTIAGCVAGTILLAAWWVIRKPQQTGIPSAQSEGIEEQGSASNISTSGKLTAPTKKREPVEAAYVENLLETHETLLALDKTWEAMNLADTFPYGPHFAKMDADAALGEVRGLQTKISQFEPLMRKLATDLNGLRVVGAEYVDKHPEIREQNDRIQLPETVKFTLGNVEAKFALTNLEGAIENVLNLLGEEYPQPK